MAIRKMELDAALSTLRQRVEDLERENASLRAQLDTARQDTERLDAALAAASKAAPTALKAWRVDSTSGGDPFIFFHEGQAEEFIGAATDLSVIPVEIRELKPKGALLDVARKARAISLSGMEPDDERLDYYTVQIDKREWEALRAALAALEEQ